VNTKMIKRKALESLNGLTEDAIKGIGKMASSMVKELMLLLTRKKKKENGKKGKELNGINFQKQVIQRINLITHFLECLN